MSMLEAAQAWHAAGCSVYPPADDGSKRPAGKWQDFQHRRMTEPEVSYFWSHTQRRDGVGIICGKVSGNLEMLELEGRATNSLAIDAIVFECQARGIDWLWDMFTLSGYSEWTPSGGLHILYRIHDHDVPGNTKVARRPATAEELAANPDDKLKVMAETRGEGGFVIVAPSGGKVHPTGDSWSVQAGQIGQIPTISWAERCLLHEAIHAALDETPKPAPIAPQRPQLTRSLDQTRPGDDFQLRASWDEILTPHGWLPVTMQAGTTYWMRPGKKFSGRNSHSATTGHAGVGAADRLYVFSSSTVFNPETPYNKFHAYAVLNHSGDFSSAAKELARLGYGTPVSSHDDARMVLDSVKAMQAPVVLEQAGAVSDTAAHAATVLPEKLLSQALERDSAGLPVYPDDIFKNEKWDHSGIADNWVDIHSDTFAYLSGQKTWMMWQGDKWARDERLSHRNSINQFCKRMRDYGERAKAQGHDLGEILAKEGKKLCTSAAQSSILNLAMTNPDVSVSVKDFDTNPNLITLRNGVLDIKTGELMPHDPALRLTRKVNASFDPDAKEGRWTRFMEEVLPDQQVREYVQRICGYMLTGTLNERVMLLIHGESGTGKTQFLEALYAVMGDFAGIAPASAFAPRQNGYKGPSEDLHKLMGKRLVLQSELDSGSRLNESLVKSIVGADMQTTRTLYGEPVDWQPEYTVFLATNYLPRISSSDNAIWNRVKPVKFEQVFINERGQALNPDDRNLGRKMAAEEADVILTWMLEGLKAYMERGLDEPEQIGLWTQGYRDDVDTTRQFISEAPEAGLITLEDTKEVGVRDLYKVYVAWCQDNAVMGLGFKVFNERMASSGWRKEKREKGIMWQGIGRVGMIVESQTSFVPKTWTPQRL